MSRKKVLLWVCILSFIFVILALPRTRIVNAEKAGESQFTLLFMEDGKWKDHNGEEKVLDDTIKLGEASLFRTVDIWHHPDSIPPHWKVTNSGDDNDMFEIYDRDLGGVEEYYFNFNEKMKDCKVEFVFSLPDKVKSAAESGKKISVTLKSGKTMKYGKELDIDKMFHGQKSQEDAEFEVDGNRLTMSLPVRCHLMTHNDMSHNGKIVVVKDIMDDIKGANGLTNDVTQKAPGTPVPDFGYGMLMGALAKWPEPKAGGKYIEVGSVIIEYANRDGNAFEYFDVKNNPWWIGNLQRKEDIDHVGTNVGTAKKFDNKIFDYFPPEGTAKDYNLVSSTVSIGSDGGFENNGAVGVIFFYPLELEFYLHEEPADISVEVSKSVSSANYDDAVNLAFSVVSAFEELDEIGYEIILEGAGAGDAIAGGKLALASPDGHLYKGEIPYTFPMPNNDVRITVKVNPADVPAEAVRENNIAVVHVDLISIPPTRGDLEIDYNILRTEKAKNLPIYLRNSTASLSLPKGEWTDNATGALNVVNGTPGIYRGFRVENNPSVNEGSESISRAPVVHLTLDRSDFGDRPQNGVYASEDIKKEGIITAHGGVNRPWKNEYTYTCHHHSITSSSSCHEVKVVETGTASASFQNILDVKNVVAKVYNGKSNLDPPKIGESVTNNGRTKELRWISRLITLDVVRLMYNEDEYGVLYPAEGILVDGQYTRKFTAQNDAAVIWDSPYYFKMGAGYEYDRSAASSRDYNLRGDDFDKAVFASDLGYKSVDYPIRSGYYFNPTGEYDLKVTTTLYKDTFEPDDMPEPEHKAFVEAMESAFRYESNMVYINTSKEAVKIDGKHADKTGTSYAAKVAAAKKGDSPLFPIVFQQADFEKDVEELEHDYDGTGNGTDERFKKVLEGYSESKTNNSSSTYKYNELVKDGQHVYEITETTVVRIKVNPDNKKVYTHAQMKNGDYKITVYIANVFMDENEIKDSVTNGRLGGETLRWVELDAMELKVVGSMYDDIR